MRKDISMLGLIFWLGLCFGVAWFGSRYSPGAWYAALNKPQWNPPNWVFAPVWTALYLGMAVAAWLVWKDVGLRSAWLPLAFFVLQLALNAAWSWLFFGLHRPDLAFAEILLLDAAILGTLIAFWLHKPIAGLLLVPYFCWVSFASVLNWALWRMNAAG